MYDIHFLSSFFHDKIYYAVLFNFLLLLVFIAINWKYFTAFFVKIDKKTWFLLFLIFISCFLIRAFVFSNQHLLYVDEALYMEAGKDMLQTNHLGAYEKSIGWPFILRLVFGLFGISNWVALYTSTLLGALTVFPLFLLAFAITKRKDISFVFILLFSLNPNHIIWSSSAATNVPSLFFISLSLFFCFLYYKHQKNSLLWLSLLGLSFTAQFRPENYSLILLFVIGCFMYIKNLSAKIDLKSILPFFVIIALSFANLVQVMDHMTSTNWIESDTGGRQVGSNWSASNLAQNSLTYGLMLFNGEQHPIMISVLLIVGLFFMFREHKKESLFLLIWMVFYWLIYFSSWFQTTGGKDRLFLSFSPAILIFASYGLFSISRQLILSFKKDWLKKVILPVFTILVMFLYIPYLMTATQTYYNFSNERLLETKIPELAEKDIPKDCIIITKYPVILTSTTDLTVVSIDDVLKQPQIQETVFNNNCVLFFEDYTCLSWRGNTALEEKCNKIKATFLLEPFKVYLEEDIQYTFYKVSKR